MVGSRSRSPSSSTFGVVFHQPSSWVANSCWFCLLLVLVVVLDNTQLSIGFTTSSSPSRRTKSDSFFLSKVMNEKASSSLRMSTSVTSDSNAETQQEFTNNPVYLAEYDGTVTFPPYSELMKLQPGDYVESNEIITLSATTDDHDSNEKERQCQFRVKLYPRGGGHTSTNNNNNKNSKKQKSGFGMSYKILPPAFLDGSPANERVGAYLQYLPSSDSDSDTFVDASFALRLLGKQRTGPKFDVEWRSGMRFVSPVSSDNTPKLSEGRANDFGSHLMQTSLLSDFLGIIDEDKDDDEPVQMRVSITIHEPPNQSSNAKLVDSLPEDNGTNESLFSVFGPRDIRGDGGSSSASEAVGELHNHDREQVRVGRVVVPVLRKLSQRPKMFSIGAYPGVEYRIMRIVDPDTDKDLFYSQPGADYELKPIYPLVKELERDWPVRVNERDIPKLYTPAMYNTASAIVSLVTAVSGLALAFAVSQAASLFVIPTRSMDPTLQIGDVLLVDKVTPRLFKGDNHRMGDVVLFHPPQALQDVVARASSNGMGRGIGGRDLFVKRVAAEPGDRFAVDRSGSVSINNEPSQGDRNLCTAEPLRLIERYIQTTDTVIPEGSVAVLGDCSSVSIDSRVWGPLPTTDIVGRPVARIWPFSRMGAIPPLPTMQANWADDN